MSSSHVQPKRVERVRQLDSAAPDVRVIRLEQLDGRGIADERARLCDDLAVDPHFARQCQRPRAFTRRRETERDEKGIEA
jgi:hypothetical protein